MQSGSLWIDSQLGKSVACSGDREAAVFRTIAVLDLQYAKHDVLCGFSKWPTGELYTVVIFSSPVNENRRVPCRGPHPKPRYNAMILFKINVSLDSHHPTTRKCFLCFLRPNFSMGVSWELLQYSFIVVGPLKACRARAECLGLQRDRDLSHLLSPLSTGIGLPCPPGGRRTLRSIASQGVKKSRGNQVIFVRGDSTSANSSFSSASSCPSSSKSTPRAGAGNDSDAKDRHRHRHSRGSNGRQDGGDAGTGDASSSSGHVAAGHDRPNLVHDINLKMYPTAAAGDENNNREIAAAGVSGASNNRRRSSSGRRNSGRRVICSGGQGEDGGLRIEGGGRDKGEGGIGGASNESENGRGRSRPNGGSDGNVVSAGAIDVRRRIQPMSALHLLLGIVVRGTKWARKRYRPTSAKA